MLCQIEKCARYAEHAYRILVIDTMATNFSDDLDNYFSPRAPWLIYGTPDLLAELDSLSAEPECVSGRITTYTSAYSGEKRNFVDDRTGQLITIDFDRQYPSPLLVHHACGGGVESLACLKRFALKDSIIGELDRRLKTIGADYDGIHVRHTDLQTDYVAFFEYIRESRADLPARKLLLCSDNKDVIEYGKTVFGDAIYTFSDIPDNQGSPIHQDRRLDKKRINSDCMLDLLMLAKSATLYASPTLQGMHSGFTMLAAGLQRNPQVIEHLRNTS